MDSIYSCCVSANHSLNLNDKDVMGIDASVSMFTTFSLKVRAYHK